MGIAIDLTKAREFAMRKHLCQLRKDCKTPYFTHLEQVVQRLERLGITNPDILCAGWLHDTIEDTSTDYDDIYEKFGKKVVEIVVSVTKDTMLPKEKREEKYRLQLKNALLEAKVVKLGDIVANIADLENAKSYSKADKISEVKKKMLYFNIIRPAIVSNKNKLPGLANIEKELNDLLVFYEQKKIILH